MSLFEHTDYKEYLRTALPSSGEGRGQRVKLAQTLGCNAGFVSQVFNGSSHFSLEHAIQVAEFLGLEALEREYFLLLVHLAKAGSEKLRRHYQEQIQRIQAERSEIRSRMVRAKTLQEADYASYYSNWTYAAIHMALSIPKFQSLPVLAAHLRIPERQVRVVVDFLVERGLVVKIDGRYQTGPTRIHLGRESPMITQHHMNWRMEAMRALPIHSEDHLHYSSVLTLSKADATRIRELILKALGEIETVLAPSPNEAIYSLGIDFFGLDRKQ